MQTATPARGARLLGAYVHFPWCLRKCPYCDFLSIATEPGGIPHERYAEAVLAELDRRAEALFGAASGPDQGTRPAVDWPRPPRLTSVFFGGGTPSLWASAALGRVLAGLKRELLTDGSAEVTVECNPSSFDLDRARALVDSGVNRVSVGVQSLDTGRLAFLGRLHGPDEALAAVDAALEAGVPRVSADLIFGVAGQTPEEAAREAQALAARGITHISAYALTIEPGTQFGARARQGRLPLLGDELVAQSFTAVSEALIDAGFEHYEISNYARAGHRAVHNLGYWRGHDYLGLGCGAWGTMTTSAGRQRYRNTPVVDRYVGSRDAWATADLTEADRRGLVAHTEPITPETALSERIMLGLRLAEGLDLDEAARDVGASDPWTPARAGAVQRLVDRGRLLRDGSRLAIPRDAWLLADGTIAEIM